MYGKRNYYQTCPYCGANLDPGERCDCDEQATDTQPGPEDVTEKCERTNTQKEN